MTRLRYKSINDFEIRTKLSRSSQGSYGVVVDAVRISDGKEFVMKFFGYTKNKPDISWILREIDNLRALEGIQGIAQIEATFTDSADGYISTMIPKTFRRKYPIIVMEKLAGGDLFERILTTKFSERDASAIFSAFMTALSQIHNDRDMINIDLKTENLVFSGSTEEIVKIIDFGMAVSLWDRSEHFEDKIVGTAAFLAPETIIHYERYGQAVYSRASDIWQAGCILFMILAAQYPFGSENTHTPQQLIQNIKSKRISDISSTGLNLSNDALDLLNKIFNLDPNQRITARDILNHPWIVNNAQLPEIDLGEVYKNRLKSWSCRKRFRRLLNRNNLGSRARQHALQAVLSLNPQALLHNINNNVKSGIISPTAATLGVVSGVDDRYMYDSSNRNYIVRSNSSCDYNPTAVTAATATDADTPAEDTATDSHSISVSPHTLNSSNFVITNAGISILKSAFVNYIFTQKQQQHYTIETALQHTGIDFEAFHLVVLTANFPNLATRAVFNIFDWNHTNTVDYLEFLFTLSSFRNDVDWSDAASVAKLYYDIFDVAQVGPCTSVQPAVMNDSNTNTINNNITISTTSKPTTDNTNSRTISVDLLVMVLSKLLIESEYGVNATAGTGVTANTLDMHNEGLHIDTSFISTIVTGDSGGDTLAPLSSGRHRNNNSINGTTTVGRRRGSSSASAKVINRYIDETISFPTAVVAPSSEKHASTNVRLKTTPAVAITPTRIATPPLPTATNGTINNITSVSPTSLPLPPAAIVPSAIVPTTTATEESEQLSMSSIFDIVQCIDTDGDGEITFKEFEAFFHAILRLKSMSMSMTNNNGTAGSSIMSLSLASLAPH